MPTITNTSPAPRATRSRRSPAPRRLFGLGALSLLCAAPAGAWLRPTGDPAGYAGAHVAHFDGVDANGLDLVWRGRIGDAGAGDVAELRLVLAPRGSAAEAARRAPWAVDGIVFVAGAPERSFAADVEGTVDWVRQRVDLQGVVSVGAAAGERVTYSAAIDELDLRGDLHRGVTAVALRAPSPRTVHSAH